MAKIHNPYLTIINKFNAYNPANFKGFDYEKVEVIAGDWNKSYAWLESNTKKAYDEVIKEFEKVGINCKLMSAKRNYIDQLYAQGETFALKLNKEAKNELKANSNLTDAEITTKAKLKTILKHPKLIKIAYLHQKQYAARIGHSEHHSGLAIDIKVDMTNVKIPEKIIQKYENVAPGMLNFITRRLIMEKHGFIQTYPQSPRIETVTGMPESEAWHWRYIGPEHSQRIGKLRELVGQDIFLEDYVDLLNFDVQYTNEQELLHTYAEIFKTTILEQGLQQNK